MRKKTNLPSTRNGWPFLRKRKLLHKFRGTTLLPLIIMKGISKIALNRKKSYPLVSQKNYGLDWKIHQKSQIQGLSTFSKVKERTEMETAKPFRQTRKIFYIRWAV